MANADQIEPGWRFYSGIVLFVLGLLSPLFIPLVTATALPTGWKTALSGLLMLGIPELLWVAAAAVLVGGAALFIKYTAEQVAHAQEVKDAIDAGEL